MIRCTICDDNQNTVSELHESITGLYPDLFELEFAYSSSDFENGNCRDCDVLIVDIDLVQSDGSDHGGIELAESLKKENSELQVIFVSAFHEYAQDIFDVDPVYYLQKPVSDLKLKKALDKALSELKRVKESRFSFVTGRDIVSVPVYEILFFESDKRLMKLFTIKAEYSFYSTVGEVEAKLNDSFIKCHQSYIVNMEHVMSLSSDRLLLDTGCSVPVSQSRRSTVRVSLTRFLGKSII